MPQRHRGPTLLVPTRVFHPYGETTSRCHRLLELQPAHPSSRCTEKEDEEVEAGSSPLPAELCRSRGRPRRAAPHRWREPGDKTIPHRREVWGCHLLAAFMVSPVQTRVQLLKKEGSRDTGGGASSLQPAGGAGASRSEADLLLPRGLLPRSPVSAGFGGRSCAAQTAADHPGPYPPDKTDPNTL